MSVEDLLRRLTEFQERWQRQPPQLGLAFAEVAGVTAEGYTLTWHSGHHDAPSAPARVSSFMAGGGRGGYFMPEIGDEVVVGFEMGNLDRPVILGALWNDRDLPPEEAAESDTNDIRTIVSRSGHEITFDDSPAGGIRLRTRGGFEISISEGPMPRITITSAGNVKDSQIFLDGICWNHQHATGAGASGPPISIVVPPGV